MHDSVKVLSAAHLDHLTDVVRGEGGAQGFVWRVVGEGEAERRGLRRWSEVHCKWRVLELM